MKIPKANEITFERRQINKLIGQKCNYCGIDEIEGVPYSANINITGTKAIYTLVMCSQKCVNGFKNNPISNAFIENEINSAKSIINKNLN